MINKCKAKLRKNLDKTFIIMNEIQSELIIFLTWFPLFSNQEFRTSVLQLPVVCLPHCQCTVRNF